MTVLRAACDRLAVRWGSGTVVHEVYVDHHDRAVLRCVSPVGGPVVVKADRDSARLAREATALAAATAAGVPVPAVLDRVDGSPAVLVLAYVEGEPLHSTSPHEHWRAVGRQLRRLHEDAVPDGLPIFGGGATWWSQLRCLADWAADWCRSRRLLAPAVLDRLQTLMAAGFGRDDEPAYCLLHGDCGPYHWVLREGAVAAVVDFGDTGRGDAAWDLAVLLLWDRDRLPVVLDGYGADQATRRHIDAVLLPYTLIRHLLAIGWLVEHGFDATPTIAELHRLAWIPDGTH